MSLPPHPASASYLSPHPSLGFAPPDFGAPPTWVASTSPLAPGPPPPPSGMTAPSALGATGGRGDKDPILFTVPKPNFILKPPDGNPLLRAAIQYDLLDALFTNDLKVFTPPPELEVGPAGGVKGQRMTFGEIYTTSLACSSKGTKSMKDKIYADPIFSRAIAMMSLLVNVGRVNTTLAFYPEMRTILRTYHAIPSLQKSEASKRHLQDAPRMKASLKGVVLDTERLFVPFTIGEVERRIADGARPPTSICNLIFTFVNSSFQLSRSHFPDGIEPLDLFLSTQGIPSAQRARAFLFLVWHYYEGPSTSDPNPFHDDFSRANPGKVPLLSPGTAGTENIDDESEIRFGDEMKAARLNHLEKVRLEGEEMKRKVASGEIAEGSKPTPGGRKRKSHAPHQAVPFSAQRAIGSIYTNSNAPSPSGSTSSLPQPRHKRSDDDLEAELDALDRVSHRAPSPDPFLDSDTDRPPHGGGVNFGVGPTIGGVQPSLSVTSKREHLMDFSDDDESSVGPAPSVTAPPGGGGGQREMMLMEVDNRRRPERRRFEMSDEEVDELESSEEEVEMEDMVFEVPTWISQPTRPPREKDLVRLAFARATSAKDILANSDLDSDSDDQCAVDLRRRLTAIRTVQLATPPLPPKPIAKAKPKKERKSSQGAASAVKMAVDPGSASAPVPPVVKLSSTAKPPSTGAAAPVASSGGGTKIKLNFGGANAAAAAAAKEKARKNSLTSLLN